MSIYFQLLLASLFWGSNVIVMKILLNEIPFLLLATIRVLFSLIFLGMYMKWKKYSFQYHHKVNALIIGVLSIYLNFFLTFLGMNEVKGIDNAFMNALAPMLTFVFSVVLLKRKGSIYEYIAIGLSVVAFLLSIHFQIFSIRIGFLYLLLGMILYMLGNVLIQKWDLSHSFCLIFYELLYGFIFLLLHCIMVGQLKINDLRQISLYHWLLFIVISGIGFAYIQIIYMKSIEQIGVLKTSFFLSFNPIVTYIESLIFLNEEFDWLHFVGFILLGSSIYIMKKKKTKHHEFRS